FNPSARWLRQSPRETGRILFRSSGFSMRSRIPPEIAFRVVSSPHGHQQQVHALVGGQLLVLGGGPTQGSE
ncbi:MAG: hypothetical protein ACE5IL_17360, partial [Myxococcota bacterium]